MLFSLLLLIASADAGEVADRINNRFVNGVASNNLQQAGVLLHQFDNTEGTAAGEKWMTCKQTWCQKFQDRWSASVVNFINSKRPGSDTINLRSTAGGFILAPTASVSCSYSHDAGTMLRWCSDNGSAVPGCVPGCECPNVASPCDNWCDDLGHDWNCAWKPTELSTMLEKYQSTNSPYNDVVISTANWTKDLPGILEALFFIGGSNCTDETKTCEDLPGCPLVRTIHLEFLAHFNVSSKDVPLLCLDLTNWNTPFHDVTHLESTVVNTINERFVNGHSSNVLQNAGVLVHHFDNTEGSPTGEKWMQCEQSWCLKFRDRWSTSIVNAKNSRRPDCKYVSLRSQRGGFIFAPTVSVHCSYSHDGGTKMRWCSNNGSAVPGCVPGCECANDVARPCDNWCDSLGRDWNCAWKPTELSKMLDKYQSTNSSYNDIVIATTNWANNLPAPIQALFFTGGAQCTNETVTCEEIVGCSEARAVHAAFLLKFHKSAAQVPLLCFDNTDWITPFKDVSDRFISNGHYTTSFLLF